MSSIHKFKNFLNKHLNVLLVSSLLISFILFLKLLWEIIEQGRITLLDKRIFEFVINLRSDNLTEIMKFITSLARVEVVVIVCLVSLAILYLNKRRVFMILLLASLLFNTLFVSIIKILVERSRPQVIYAIVNENNFSFPSGHSIIAVCFYGIIIFFIISIIKNNYLKSLLSITGILVILLIGFSRIYLGVHWPTDVVGSYLIGISWFCLIMLFLHNENRLKKFILNIFKVHHLLEENL